MCHERLSTRGKISGYRVGQVLVALRNAPHQPAEAASQNDHLNASFAAGLCLIKFVHTAQGCTAFAPKQVMRSAPSSLRILLVALCPNRLARPIKAAQ
jgi:hypothetical protein